MAQTESGLPIGDPVRLPETIGTPRRQRYSGKFVTLAPVDPETDAAALYACAHGTQQKEDVWTYMGYGPFADESDMKKWLRACAADRETLFLTVRAGETAVPVGMVSFLNIVPAMLRLELGHIWYGPAVQRTPVNTEACYLMLCEAFDHLAYRRVEWKCDALNAASRRAALRLGFQYEGLFRQHRIYKGRNRDTAWYALLHDDWPAVKRQLEQWLGM